MKMLITGGCGFIGCNIARFYLERGNKVVVLDDLSRSGSDKNLEWLKQIGKVEFIKQDITDYGRFKNAINSNKDVDVIYHMAAQVAVTTSVAEPRRDFEINATGTFNLLEAVRELKINPVIIYASTNKVYGEMAGLKIVEKNGRYQYEDLKTGVSERTQLDFHSPYGCSKGCADQYVIDYARIYGLRTVSMRQSCLSGNSSIFTPKGLVSIAEIKGKQIGVFCFNKGEQIDVINTAGSFETSSQGKSLFLIITKRGYKIEATEDHKFFTPNGYKRLDSLMYGSLVAVCPKATFIKQKPPNKLSSKVFLSQRNFEKCLRRCNRRKKYNKEVLKRLRELGFIPLRCNNSFIYSLARLTGYLTGDGHLFRRFYKRLNKTMLGIQVYGLAEELDSIKDGFRIIGFNPGKTTKSTSKSKLLNGHIIEGDSCKFSVYATEAFVLFESLGVPIGSKSSVEFGVPKWILHGPKEVQDEYLRGLFGAELGTLNIYTERKTGLRGKSAPEIQPIMFSQSKNVNLRDNALKFRRQIISLLKDRNISFRTQELKFTYKKSGDKSISFQFLIHANRNNILNFAKIGYAFNKKREIRLYCLAEFFKSGLPMNFYNQWLKEQTHGIGSKYLFWDKIIQIKKIPMRKIFDLTVPKNHNFIANGFVVHNCIYGQRQFGVEDQGWVAWFTIAAVLGKPITIYGDGKQVRDILYIDDLIKLFHIVSANIDKVKGVAFNVGGGPNNQMSLLELISILEDKLKKKIKIKYANWRPGDQKIYVSDISKAERLLGWKPKVSKEEGIDRLIEWVQGNRELFAQSKVT